MYLTPPTRLSHWSYSPRRERTPSPKLGEILLSEDAKQSTLVSIPKWKNLPSCPIRETEIKKVADRAMILLAKFISESYLDWVVQRYG